MKRDEKIGEEGGGGDSSYIAKLIKNCLDKSPNIYQGRQYFIDCPLNKTKIWNWLNFYRQNSEIK